MPSDPDQFDADDLARQAESVWFAAVELAASGAPDLEDLCSQHPHLTDELRQIQADWGWLEGHLGPEGDQDQDGPEELTRLVRGFDHSRYTRIEEMARGGGGRIDRIWDALLKRSLAMKVAMVRVPDGGASRSRVLARFLEEAQVTGQLQHPGIVPMHDVGIDDEGFAFFTMNLVEGIDLGEAFRLARAGAEDWTLQRAVRALASVADTLAYAHDRGVLHRDVKPSNVRVGPFGEVYVMDWGLARVAGTPDPQETGSAVQSVRSGSSTDVLLTSEGAVIGTPAYMPPEQARGELSELDERADVYAVGAMLYELLAGRPPYAGKPETSTPQDVAAAVASSPPASLDTLAPEATPELVAIATRAMARRSQDRYRNMAQLGVELRAFLEGRVVHAHRTGALVEIQKWVLRNRLSAAALLSFVLALGVAAWIQYDRSRELRGVNSELLTTNNDLDRARDEAVREAHFARLAAAQASLRAGNGRSARNHLQACATERRGWGWNHLWSRAENSESQIEIQIGLASPGTFALSDDGRFAAGQSLRVAKLEHNQDSVNELRFYDLDQGTDRASKLSGMVDVCFVPGTSLLVYATGTGVHVVDSQQPGAVLAQRDAHLEGLDLPLLTVSADGMRVAHREGRSFAIVRPRDLHLIEACEPQVNLGDVVSIALSPDGKLLACLNRRGVLTLIESDGKLVASTETSETDGLSYPPPLCFSASGALLAVGLSSGDIQLFDVPDCRPVASIAASKEHISALAFSPTGNSIACGVWDGTVSVFDTLSGTATLRGYGHESMVISLGWERDGHALWSASRDGTLRTWRPARGTGLDLLSTRSGADVDLAADPLRPRAATANTDSVLYLWDTSSGDLIARCDFTMIPRFSPLSAVFIPSSGDLLVATRQTGIMRMDGDTLELQSRLDPTGGRLLTVSADSSHLACEFNGEVRVVSIEDSSSVQRLSDVENPSALAFGVDSSELWIGNTAGELSRWSFEGGTPEKRTSRHMGAAIVALGSHAGLLALGLSDGRVELRSTADGGLVAELGRGSGAIENLSFHPSDPLLVSSSRTSAGDSNLRLWDTQTFELQCELIGPEGRLSRAQFCGGGGTIAAQQTHPKGLALLDSVETYRGTGLVEVARERVRERVDALRKEWPYVGALVQVWSTQEGLDPHERRAGHRMALERLPHLSHTVAAIANLLADPDRVARAPEASTLIARHVATRGVPLAQRLSAIRLLLVAGNTTEAAELLQSLEPALSAADEDTQRIAQELTSDVEAALTD